LICVLQIYNSFVSVSAIFVSFNMFGNGLAMKRGGFRSA